MEIENVSQSSLFDICLFFKNSCFICQWRLYFITYLMQIYLHFDYICKPGKKQGQSYRKLEKFLVGSVESDNILQKTDRLLLTVPVFFV